MYRKLISLVSLVLVLALVSNASAVFNWTGAVSRDWTNPANWNSPTGLPPTTADADNTSINPGNYTGAALDPLIGPGQVAFTAAWDTWGPEWGATLDIEGGIYAGPAWVGMVAVGDYDNPSTINLGAGNSGGLIDIHNFLIGDSWWWHGGPIVTYNQYSGTCIANDYIWLGGQMNLHGGYTRAQNGFVMDSAGFTSAITTMNIYGYLDKDGGKMSLPAQWGDPNDPIIAVDEVNSWIANGYLTANGGDPNWQILIWTDWEADRIVLTSGYIPEPATIALLGLGALALIRRKRS